MKKEPTTQMQAMLQIAETYAAPWRERNLDGTLGAEYGPLSPTTFARQLNEFRQWAFRKDTAQRAKAPADEGVMVAVSVYVDANDVPRREREVFELLAKGHSRRFVARALGVRRETVKSFWKRLRARAGV